MGWSVTRDLYGTISSASTISETYNVQSLYNITLQLVGSPSTTTVQGSNDNGTQGNAITNWSTITSSIGIGMYSIAPGFRWLRCLRSETTNAILSGWERSF